MEKEFKQILFKKYWKNEISQHFYGRVLSFVDYIYRRKYFNGEDIVVHVFSKYIIYFNPDVNSDVIYKKLWTSVCFGIKNDKPYYKIVVLGGEISLEVDFHFDFNFIEDIEKFIEYAKTRISWKEINNGK